MDLKLLPELREVRLDELDWLHDADLPTTTFDSSPSRGRLLMFSVNVHPNAGYPAWDGRWIYIVAVDVLCLKMHTYPVAGIEQINGFHLSESDTFRAERDRGLTGLEYVIFFHSGDEIRFICERLLVSETPTDDRLHLPM